MVLRLGRRAVQIHFGFCTQTIFLILLFPLFFRTSSRQHLNSSQHSISSLQSNASFAGSFASFVQSQTLNPPVPEPSAILSQHSDDDDDFVENFALNTPPYPPSQFDDPPSPFASPHHTPLVGLSHTSEPSFQQLSDINTVIETYWKMWVVRKCAHFKILYSRDFLPYPVLSSRDRISLAQALKEEFSHTSVLYRDLKNSFPAIFETTNQLFSDKYISLFNDLFDHFLTINHIHLQTDNVRVLLKHIVPRYVLLTLSLGPKFNVPSKDPTAAINTLKQRALNLAQFWSIPLTYQDLQQIEHLQNPPLYTQPALDIIFSAVELSVAYCEKNDIAAIESDKSKRYILCTRDFYVSECLKHLNDEFTYKRVFYIPRKKPMRTEILFS